jgi:3-dehydroquinate synthase
VNVAETLRIASGQGDYDVVFHADLASVIAALQPASRPFVIVDERVAELYPQLAAAFDADRIMRIPATEEEKTLAGVERVCAFLRGGGANKTSRLVLIGGGIIQDIGAFSAHIYHRGIPYTLVPTTLLSMADSSIGAKTGVNLGAFKNQLGFFQSPAQVENFSGFLGTLPADDLRSGFGEILKLALISGPADFERLTTYVERSGFAIDGIDELVRMSLLTKKKIIEVDEYEKGLRAILNFGHTFGHALEGLTGHEIPHGLAVAWGVDVATYVAARRGMMPQESASRVHAFIERYYARPLARRHSGAELVRAMGTDKKAASGGVKLILPAAIGDLRVVPTALDDALTALLDDYLSTIDIFAEAARA